MPIMQMIDFSRDLIGDGVSSKLTIDFTSQYRGGNSIMRTMPTNVMSPRITKAAGAALSIVDIKLNGFVLQVEFDRAPESDPAIGMFTLSGYFTFSN